MTASLIAMGAVEGLLLGLALLARRDNRRANRWLGLLLLAAAGALVVPLVQDLDGWAARPRIGILLSGLPLLFGPLLLLYVGDQVADRRFVRGPWWAVHALLPAAFMALVGPLLLLPTEVLATVLKPEPEASGLGVVPLAKYLSFGAYSVAALWLLRIHDRRLRETLAEVEPHSLVWLRRVAWTALGLEIALVVLRLLRLDGGFQDALFAAVLSLLILAAGFHGLRQPEAFAELRLVPAPPGEPPTAPDTPEDPASEDPVAAKLRTLSSRPDLLFAHDLSLGRLARQLGVTPHQASHALNRVLGESFYDHVNRLRVEAVQRALLDPARAGSPIFDLAVECGFSNKTTFNKAFKQVTGTTPSAWRQSASAVPQAG